MQVITTDISYFCIVPYSFETCDDLKLLSHNCGPVRDQTALYCLFLGFFFNIVMCSRNKRVQYIMQVFIYYANIMIAINAPFANGIAPSHRISDGFVAVLSSSCHTIFFQPPIS